MDDLKKILTENISFSGDDGNLESKQVEQSCHDFTDRFASFLAKNKNVPPARIFNAYLSIMCELSYRYYCNQKEVGRIISAKEIEAHVESSNAYMQNFTHAMSMRFLRNNMPVVVQGNATRH